LVPIGLGGKVEQMIADEENDAWHKAIRKMN
jgi:hypothetical protein